MYNLSRDAKVCARLQADEMPLVIYDSIKESDPVKAQRLIKNIDSKILFILTELILKLTVGNDQLENKMSKQVIQDLEVLQQFNDSVFIDKLLLPLFKLEHTLPVTIMQKMDSP